MTGCHIPVTILSMNFLQRVENFLMNQFGGKAVARVSVVAAGGLATWLGSAKVQAAISLGIAKAGPILDAVGLHVQVGAVNPILLTSLIGGAAQIAFEMFKASRASNPDSPTVQTDPAKPNAGVLPVLPTK